MTILEERALSAASNPASAPGMAARRAMIDSQLRVSGVNDSELLAAFARVAREDFVPEAFRGNAYIDRALPLGTGAMLAAPLVHGLMLTEAAPTAQDRVLIVTACGYLPALVAALGCAVEVLSPADAAAPSRRKGAGATLLLIDGAIEQLPAALAARLAEGGRVVTGLVERGVTRLAAGTKLGGDIALLPLAEIGMPVLAEFAAPRRWSF